MFRFVFGFILFIGLCIELGQSYVTPTNLDVRACKILIETIFRENCSVTLRPNYEGHVMFALQKGKENKGIEYCRKVPEGAGCVLEKLPALIPDDCKTLEEYQSKIVVAQHDKAHSEYYCANNMQFYRDKVESDGMDCLYVTEFYNCIHRTHRTRRIRFTRKEELCRTQHLYTVCSEHWGPCENQKVRNIELGSFEVLKQAMECPQV